MITVLMTPSDDATEFRSELRKWYAKMKCKPTAIVGHKDLVYALVNDPKLGERGETTVYDGVPVLTMSQLWELHAEQFGEKGHVEVDD